MALDRQRILGELGSVMKQLQSADCGCLGKLFDNPQHSGTPVGSSFPPCGGCRRACCHSQNYCHYNTPTSMNQPSQNTTSMPMSATNSSQQPMPGNMFGYGPQIVNMMRGDHSNPRNQNIPEQGQGQLTSPMVIDAPQSPHGKVGLTPFAPSAGSQQGQFNPDVMNQGNVAGQMQQQLMPQSNLNAAGYTPNMTSWPQQQNMNPAAPQMPAHSNQHGPHSQGIAKFHQMFPGVKQGMGGDLGFDPMAIAIQMNPDNKLQSAMNTMNMVMNDNKGLNKMYSNTPVAQPVVAGNSSGPQNPPGSNNMMQQDLVPEQATLSYGNQMTNRQMPVTQNITNPNQLLPSPQNTVNPYGQPIPQQSQQIYASTNKTSLNNQQMPQSEENRLMDDQHQYQQHQYGSQQIIDLNASAPNLPATIEEPMEKNQAKPMPEQQQGYSNEIPSQEMIKEPIFPADASSRYTYTPTKRQRNYGYNTLGQPVEMLPAKMYHPPEPSLPQTLSPQAYSTQLRNVPLKAVNVKSTISKTSLMEKKQIGRNPSIKQLQQIYNQYKGSQSFTQQNVRQPGEATYSDGRLNVPQAYVTKTPLAPVEKVGGDTVVTNPPGNQLQMTKVGKVMEQIGDVPTANTAGDFVAKEVHMPLKKCRNGLQDMAFTSYPISTAWTFHGHGRNELISPHHYRSRH